MSPLPSKSNMFVSAAPAYQRTTLPSFSTSLLSISSFCASTRYPCMRPHASPSLLPQPTNAPLRLLPQPLCSLSSVSTPQLVFDAPPTHHHALGHVFHMSIHATHALGSVPFPCRVILPCCSYLSSLWLSCYFLYFYTYIFLLCLSVVFLYFCSFCCFLCVTISLVICSLILYPEIIASC